MAFLLSILLLKISIGEEQLSGRVKSERMDNFEKRGNTFVLMAIRIVFGGISEYLITLENQ